VAGRVLFDRYVVVDWSARSTPARGADSLWVAWADREHDLAPTLRNPPTRAEALALVVDLVCARPDAPVLVTLDAPFAWPAGTATAWRLGGGDPPWQRVWHHLAGAVHDDGRNRNNRFAVASELNGRVGPGPGPFWGCPPSAATPTLSPRRAPGFPVLCDRADPALLLAERRACEEAVWRTGRWISSPWQLHGRGAVGGQALTAVPVLHAWRTHPALASRVEVWPFTTGLGLDPTRGRADAVVLAEAWPSAVPVPPTGHPVRDARQVATLAAHLRQRDRAGRLALDFAPDVRGCDVDPMTVVTEEGWILGVHTPT